MDNTTIPPTAAELWLFVRELDEVYWRVRQLCINPGDLERIKKEVGELAEAIERKTATTCRMCYEALEAHELGNTDGMCLECYYKYLPKAEAVNAV